MTAVIGKLVGKRMDGDQETVELEIYAADGVTEVSVGGGAVAYSYVDAATSTGVGTEDPTMTGYYAVNGGPDRIDFTLTEESLCEFFFKAAEQNGPSSHTVRAVVDGTVILANETANSSSPVTFILAGDATFATPAVEGLGGMGLGVALVLPAGDHHFEALIGGSGRASASISERAMAVKVTPIA